MCLLVQWLPFCFHVLLPNPCGTCYADLFLNFSWFLFSTGGVVWSSPAKVQRLLPYQPWAVMCGQRGMQDVSSASSSQSGCLSGGEKNRKVEKEKEKNEKRIKVLIVKRLTVPVGNESRATGEITDGDGTEVHYPAAH